MITNEEVKNIFDTIYAGNEELKSLEGGLSKNHALKALNDGKLDNELNYRHALWDMTLNNPPFDLLTLLKLNERFPNPDPEIQKYIYPASITFNENPLHVIFIDSIIQSLGKAVDNKMITFELFEFLMNEIDKIASDKAKEKRLEPGFIKDTLSKVKEQYNYHKNDTADKEDIEQLKSEEQNTGRVTSSSKSLAEQGTNLLQALLRLIDEGESYDDIKEALFDAYPEIDQAKLEKELDRAVYITAVCSRNGSAQ
ncbi:MAG: DUF935 domain-containing protein [bacterium]|nr:DUF935 domain-containing protein [bacterium]